MLAARLSKSGLLGSTARTVAGVAFWAACAAGPVWASPDDGFSPPPVMFEEADGHSDDHSGSHGTGKRSPKRRPFTAYGKYIKSFTALCEGVVLDGRQPKLSSMLESPPAEVLACVECRAMFKMFSKACRKAAAAPRGTKKITPTPAPLQRDPHPSVVQAIPFAFGTLAADETNAELHLKVVKMLIAILEDPAGKSEGEKDYFSTFARYAYVPFKPVAAAIARRERSEAAFAPQGGGAPTPGPSVDSLFE